MKDQRLDDLKMLSAVLKLPDLDEALRHKYSAARVAMLHGTRHTLSPAMRASLKEYYVPIEELKPAPRGSSKLVSYEPTTVQCGRLPLTPPGRGVMRYKDGAP